MNAREARIKSWAEREDMTLPKMWAECEKRGYTDYLAEARETMIGFVHQHIDDNLKVAPLLASIENNPWADYYAFDVTSYSNVPAKPIYTKQELMAVLT